MFNVRNTIILYLSNRPMSNRLKKGKWPAARQQTVITFREAQRLGSDSTSKKDSHVKALFVIYAIDKYSTSGHFPIGVNF